MNTTPARPGQCAIWRYDLFPFACIGTITEVCPKGRYPADDGNVWVETKEFGKGNYFKLQRVVSPKEGKRIKAELEVLSEHQSAALSVLQNAFKQQASAIHGLKSK